MAYTAEDVRKLRELTGAGMLDCKNALESAGGNYDKAVEILREQGHAAAAKRAERETAHGIVENYMHHNKTLGAMVELNCETDFVAKTPGFKQLAHDIAMQITAMNPQYISREQIDKAVIEKEIEIYKSQATNEGKPANIAEKIAQGRLDKFYEEVCLMEQSFIKDSGKTIKDLLDEATGKVGEKVLVRRFKRFQLGEDN